MHGDAIPNGEMLLDQPRSTLPRLALQRCLEETLDTLLGKDMATALDMLIVKQSRLGPFVELDEVAHVRRADDLAVFAQLGKGGTVANDTFFLLAVICGYYDLLTRKEFIFELLAC